MTTMMTESQAKVQAKQHPPKRFHHNNFYTNDFNATRHFYEDLAGIPLCAFWVEPFPDTAETRAHVCGHAFFKLSDGAMMAFMHYPDPDLQAKMVGTEQPGSVHIAMEVDREQFDAIKARLDASEYEPFVVDHGIAHALYVRDPNGLLVEFSLDGPDANSYYYQDPVKAHEGMERYIAGDRSPNTPERNFV